MKPENMKWYEVAFTAVVKGTILVEEDQGESMAGVYAKRSLSFSAGVDDQDAEIGDVDIRVDSVHRVGE